MRQTVRMGVAIIAGAVLFGVTAQVAGAEDGKALYDKNCRSCHGDTGKGDGPAAKALKPPPQDFAGKAILEADITKVITDGKAGDKAHPAFGKKLNDEQMKAVSQHVKQLTGK